VIAIVVTMIVCNFNVFLVIILVRHVPGRVLISVYHVIRIKIDYLLPRVMNVDVLMDIMVRIIHANFAILLAFNVLVLA